MPATAASATAASAIAASATAASAASATAASADPMTTDLPSMPRSTEFLLDPYPWYRRMRSEHPVWRDPHTGTWIVFSHADVHRVLTDPATYSSALPPAPEQELFTTSMNNTDPPRHDELRALVQRRFAPRRIGSLAPRIAAIADDLITDLIAAGSGSDVVGSFSGALPAIVVAEILGVPPGDRDRFRAWADGIVLIGEPDRIDEAYAAMGAMAGYLSDLVRRKKDHPGDDVMTELAAAHDAGAISDIELVDFGLLLLTGGHETTTSLINNTLRCLHDHPAARARVDLDPGLVPALLEEVLRFRAPVQMLERVATTRSELAGVTIDAGEILQYCMGSANRDPQAFADPEVFDIDRRPTAHLAFGYGLHGCLGNALARLEARIAITSLLHRLPGIDLDEEHPIEPIPTPQLHGAKRLHVRF